MEIIKTKIPSIYITKIDEYVSFEESFNVFDNFNNENVRI
jgi:hypothetical protein